MSTPFRLLLPRPLYEEMLQQAGAELPNECCGLLSGKWPQPGEETALVVRRYPLVNELGSPTEYHAAKSLFAAHRDMREHGIDILAIYHSHPTSAAVPSRKDRERNLHGPLVVHLIVSLAGAEPVVRGWRLTETEGREAEWEVIEGVSVFRVGGFSWGSGSRRHPIARLRS